MAGRLAISASNISSHLRCGDKSKDWVFAGAIVFKSGLKTSQKVIYNLDLFFSGLNQYNRIV